MPLFSNKMQALGLAFNHNTKFRMVNRSSDYISFGFKTSGFVLPAWCS